MNVNKITIPVYYTIKFSEITFHALNKEKGYVMLQLDLANEIILNQDFIIRKHEYLFIYPKEKLDGKIQKILIYFLKILSIE